MRIWLYSVEPGTGKTLGSADPALLPAEKGIRQHLAGDVPPVHRRPPANDISQRGELGHRRWRIPRSDSFRF
jgi:hypothetical protein